MTTTCRSTSSMTQAGRCHRLLALMALAVFAQAASAASDPCTWTITSSSGTQTVAPINVLIANAIALGSLSSVVPADQTPGTTIGPASINFTVSASCSSSQYFNLKSSSTPATSPSGVWQVPGIPGVGMELKVNGVLMSDLANGSIRNIGALSTTFPTTTFTYRLVRTSTRILGDGGTLTSKTQSIPASNYFQLGGSTTSSGFPSPVVRFLGPGVTAVFPVSTCSVGSTSVAVSLPTIKLSSLATVGSTTGDTDFNFSMTCTAGSNAYATLTDGTTTGNTSDKLTLASTSTASGVALQILYNGSPKSFGSSSSVAGNPGQFSVGTTPSGAFSLPLTARYIRTGTVVPGTVKATATITMSYQ